MENWLQAHSQLLFQYLIICYHSILRCNLASREHFGMRLWRTAPYFDYQQILKSLHYCGVQMSCQGTLVRLSHYFFSNSLSYNVKLVWLTDQLKQVNNPNFCLWLGFFLLSLHLSPFHSAALQTEHRWTRFPGLTRGSFHMQMQKRGRGIPAWVLHALNYPYFI